MQHVWGRDLEWIWNWWFWEISPTLILVTVFIQRKQKWKEKKGLYRFWTLGSLNFIEWKNEKFFIFLKHLIIFLKFYLYYLFLFLRVSFFLFLLNCFFNFILGKPNKMGNLVGWRHEEKVHEVCGILTWKSSPSLEKNTRVKLHIHEAKLCICSA